MRVQDIGNMLNFTYVKTTKEITDACHKKIAVLGNKIQERKGRLSAMREEYKITDAILIELLQQARKAQNDARQTYQTSNMVKGSDGKFTEETFTVGAGVVNMLLTETDFIEGEKKQAEKLTLIVGNLRDVPDENGFFRGHHLSEDALRYLGF
jgi:hypothetical protein